MGNHVSDQTMNMVPISAQRGFAVGAMVGPYRILRKIGEGGMGIVYEAEHTLLHQHFAIKTLMLREEGNEDSEEDTKRFLLEARITAQLRHEGIVSVQTLEVDQATGILYFVMEYVAMPRERRTALLLSAVADGGAWLRAPTSLASGENLKSLSLEELYQYARKQKRRIQTRLVWRILLDVSAALQSAHTFGDGIIHRDIKPANILIRANGRAVVADFGVAKIVGENFRKAMLRHQDRSLSLRIEADGSSYHMILGTMEYLAPELRTGTPPSPKTDLYALGVVAYQLLTGEIFSGNARAPSAFGVPKVWDRAILGCLHADPEKRWKDLATFHRVLQKLPLQQRLSKLWKAGVAILGLLIIVGLGFLLLGKPPERRGLWVRQPDAALYLRFEETPRGYILSQLHPDFCGQLSLPAWHLGRPVLGRYENAIAKHAFIPFIAGPQQIFSAPTLAEPSATNADDAVTPAKMRLTFAFPNGLQVGQLEDGTWSILGVTKDASIGERLFIPADIMGAAVTEIAPNAFLGNQSVRKVTLPKTIRVIHEGAFKNSTLEQITLSEGLKQIRASAFYGSRLKSIHLPKSVSFLGPYLFQNSELESLTSDGNQLPEQGDSLFLGTAQSGVSIHLKGANKHYIWREGRYYAADEDKNSSSGRASRQVAEKAVPVYGVKKSYTFPADDEAVRIGTVNDKALSTVQLPKALKTIESMTFGYTILDKVPKLPESVTAIKGSAFYEMRVVQPDVLRIPSGIQKAPRLGYIFGLTGFALPGVTEVPRDALADIADGCPAETFRVTFDQPNVLFRTGSIKIHASAKWIPISLVFPKGATPTFEKDAISSGAVELLIEGEAPRYWDGGRAKVWRQGRHPDVEKRKKNLQADADYRAARGPDGGSAIEQIGNPYLLSYRVPETIDGRPTTIICRNLFRYCTWARTIELPDTVNSIATEAFHWTASLQKMTFPKSVRWNQTHLRHLFLHCKLLEEVTFLSTPDAFPDEAFYDCSSLRRVKLAGKKLPTFSPKTFYKCPNEGILVELFEEGKVYLWKDGMLTHVDGSEIDPSEFIDRTKETPKEVTTPAEAKTDTPKTETLQATDEQIKHQNLIYEKLTNNQWRLIGITPNVALQHIEVADKIKSLPVTAVARDAFMYNKHLRSITFPDTLTTLGEGVFYDCKSLQEVTFKSEIKHLPASLFKGCDALTKITIHGTTPPTVDPHVGVSPKQTSMEFTFPTNKDAETGFIYNWESSEMSTWVEIDNVRDGFYLGQAKASYIKIPPKTKLSATYTLPTTGGGKPVYRVGKQLFKGNQQIQHVTLPEGYTEIGRDAFCSSTLKTIVLPASLKRIEPLAFHKTPLSRMTFKGDTLPANLESALKETSAPQIEIFLEGANATYLWENGKLTSPSSTTGNDTPNQPKTEETVIAPIGGNIEATFLLNFDQTYSLQSISESKGVGKTLVIPAKINNRPVASVLPNAFKNLSAQASIILEDHLVFDINVFPNHAPSIILFPTDTPPILSRMTFRRAVPDFEALPNARGKSIGLLATANGITYLRTRTGCLVYSVDPNFLDKKYDISRSRTITIPYKAGGWRIEGVLPGAFTNCAKLKIHTVNLSNQYPQKIYPGAFKNLRTLRKLKGSFSESTRTIEQQVRQDTGNDDFHLSTF